MKRDITVPLFKTPGGIRNFYLKISSILFFAVDFD